LRIAEAIKNYRKNKNRKEEKYMIKKEVENLCFNEKGNYQEKKQRHKKKRWVGKDAPLYCVCRGSQLKNCDAINRTRRAFKQKESI
jgi:hypothetical protein